VIAETRPAARTGFVIFILFGLAHEGQVTPQAQPKFLQGIAIGSEYSDDTLFTTPPPNVVVPMSKALAPLAHLLGYQSVYPRFLAPEFWAAHVEQPA
jgi:hypothetical protein